MGEFCSLRRVTGTKILVSDLLGFGLVLSFNSTSLHHREYNDFSQGNGNVK